jgi:hypothetical protein
VTPLREWFQPGFSFFSWIPKSKEAWALIAAIVVVGAMIGRIG